MGSDIAVETQSAILSDLDTYRIGCTCYYTNDYGAAAADNDDDDDDDDNDDDGDGVDD